MMEKKSDFKNFVKKNPVLINYVKNNNMTWQKFYELYDLYGEDENIWKEYLIDKKTSESNINIFDFIKNIDFDTIQTGVSSMQRVISLLQDMSSDKKNVNTNKEEYKPRPLYKHFED